MRPEMSALRKLARRLPFLRELHTYILALESERDELRAHLAHWKTWMSPGHFYSPIPNVAEVQAREAELFGPPPPAVPGIELNVERQLALFAELARFYPEQPFPHDRSPESRYWFRNGAFSYGDALFLYSMLRQVRPKRIIEIGSGFSSAVMLETRERFLDAATELTFIDPDVSTVQSLLRVGDRAEVIAAPVQAIPLERFDVLQANDILFVDSTHISKTGSDVNRIVFDILPRLASGVYVHFHDIFYPFEYPKEWVYEGRAWNEDYLVRAFLLFNSAFEVVLFNNYLGKMHADRLRAQMPLVLENPGGGLWLRRR
jgi:predicted O-methyltransferase YrrM